MIDDIFSVYNSSAMNSSEKVMNSFSNADYFKRKLILFREIAFGNVPPRSLPSRAMCNGSEEVSSDVTSLFHSQSQVIIESEWFANTARKNDQNFLHADDH